MKSSGSATGRVRVMEDERRWGHPREVLVVDDDGDSIVVDRPPVDESDSDDWPLPKFVGREEEEEEEE